MSNLRRLPKTVVVLGAVSFFNDLASEMVTPLIPILLAAVFALFTFARASETFIVLRGHQMGIGVVELLLMWSASSFAKALSSLRGGWWADRLGHERLVLFGWLSHAVAFALLAFAASGSTGTEEFMNWISRAMALCGALFWMAGAVGADVPAAGSAAPEFALPDQGGRTVRLADYRGKWVVLYFYPKDDTPGCTEEACAFRDDLAKLTQLGAQILGVSVDDTASHAAFAKKHGLPFPLLADVDAGTATRYGAVKDVWVTRFAKRYTFLIDPQGRIARTYLKVDTSRHSAEIIADLKQLTGK